MIVPFAISSDQFIDNVRYVGNILHRLRVPLRVAEAEKLARAGMMIEEFDQLAVAAKWLGILPSPDGKLKYSAPSSLPKL